MINANLMQTSNNLLILNILCFCAYLSCLTLLVYFNHKNKYNKIHHLLVCAWFMHALLIVFTWFSNGIYFGFAHTLSIMACSGVGLYLYEKKYTNNMQSMQLVMVYMALICVCLPYVFVGQANIHLNNGLIYTIIRIIHFVGMHVTYAILMWIIIHIVMIILFEKKLHGATIKYKFAHNLFKQLNALPSLSHMYLILNKRLYILWICMTIVITTGLYLSLQQHAMHISHKIVFSVIAWIGFSIFLYKKYTLGLSSKQTVYYIICICILWILAYIGSDFVKHVLISSH
jgi:ABC-type uncharacterized transport system permease subunit